MFLFDENVLKERCPQIIPSSFEKNMLMMIYYQKKITVLSNGEDLQVIFRNMLVNIKFGHCEPTTAHPPESDYPKCSA